MKNILTVLLLCVISIFCSSVSSQAPAALNYQAVARNAGGVVTGNQLVSLRFSIHDIIATGTVVFQETDTATTNQFGLFTTAIGNGSVITGNLAALAWGNGLKFLQVEIDPLGGTNYTNMGATQLLSVPYALYSGNSAGGWSLTGNNGTIDTTNFIGTTDALPLNFRVNNVAAGRIEPGNSNGNVALGYLSLKANSSGNGNSAFGSWALESNTTGTGNTAIGANTLLFNTSANYNTAVGASALASNTGNNNTAIGVTALNVNAGMQNTAVGMAALYSNLGASYNTAVGSQSLYVNSTGAYNTATGYEALYSNSTGGANTATGFEALYTNTTYGGNTATGYQALYATDAPNNTADGYFSLFYNAGGPGNTAVGSSSLYENTQGGNNTAVGYDALYYNQTGSQNTAIGYNAGTSASYSNTVSIGNNGYANAASNQAFLGNVYMVWNGGNVTWSTYSDARVKNNVQEDVKGLDFITRLRPVTYYRSTKAMTEITGNKETPDYPGKYDVEKIKFSGFLAQDVEKAAKASGYDFSGITVPANNKELYTLSYEQFVVPLVKAIQEQQKMIEELKKEMEELKKK